jgi:predicted ATPase
MPVADGEALATLEDALSLATRTGEQFFVPELHRLKGEASLAREPEYYAPAEECFQTACAAAFAQSGRSLELRARRSLAGLPRKSGDRARERKALIEILDSFSEGFQTNDLKLAKSIVESVP